MKRFRALLALIDPTALSRRMKLAIVLLTDLLTIPVALLVSFVLQWESPLQTLQASIWIMLVGPLVTIPVLYRFGLYRAVVRYLNARTLSIVVQGTIVSATTLAIIDLAAFGRSIPATQFVIFGFATIALVAGSRFLAQHFLHILSRHLDDREKVAIYGAGDSGTQLEAALHRSKEMQPVAFFDDNLALRGTMIHGLQVYSSTDIGNAIRKHEISTVLLAMPSVRHAERKRVVDYLEEYPVHVRTIPSMIDIAAGNATIDDIREIDIEDLLGRETISPNASLMNACTAEKVVMVTGAGGSIGSELCRQIITTNPTKLILFELTEFALYSIERELRSTSWVQSGNVELVPLLGNVQEQAKLETIIRTFNVSTIYHAAAYKHVPLVEHNIVEGVRNNVFGTLSAAQAALNAGVETFVLISTDKAVRPTNVMGASKRLAELVLQALQDDQERSGQRNTTFCMVRFGNVLGSSGSVVPLFRDQIQNCGPVTVTHAEITRYFMSIPEAAQLVIQAGAMAGGGDVFVLDMGEPVKIVDLAHKLIHLHGYSVRSESNPNGDIEIEFTGLRPGEKLYEELLIGENPRGTEHPRIMRAKEDMIDWPSLSQRLTKLRTDCEQASVTNIYDHLEATVSGYKAKSESVDHLWNATQKKLADTLTSNVNDLNRMH